MAATTIEIYGVKYAIRVRALGPAHVRIKDNKNIIGTVPNPNNIMYKAPSLMRGEVDALTIAR
jgi:hypothetical protein